METLAKVRPLEGDKPQNMAGVQRPRKRRNAQGLVEFALILPLLLVLLFSAIDFGWMVFNYGQLFNGLREGLRYGTVTGYTSTKQYLDCSGIKKRIRDYAGFSGIKDSNITIYYDDGNNAYVTPAGDPHFSSGVAPQCDGTKPIDFQNGYRVRVKIDVTVNFLSPFFRSMFNGMNIKLTAARSVSQLA
jgi:Flp pilus assembly protein TadG